MGVARWAVLWAALILLPCMPALAQNTEDGDGPSQGQYQEQREQTPARRAACPGAVAVDTITGTGDQETQVYGFRGESLRLTATIESLEDEVDPLLVVGINEENGDIVSSFTVEREGTESTIVNAAPGRFFFDISTVTASYTIVVEDCRGAGGGDDGDDGNGEDDSGDVDDPDDVVHGTGKDKPLPKTGGVPLLFGAAALVLAAGLVVRRTLGS